MISHLDIFVFDLKMMTYEQTIEYLYNSVPMFQKVGATAYKEGLHNTIALDNHFGNPHLTFKTIHIAGTNGKGSCSHSIAAILQSAGYKVGLYTSPHLKDFRERIRINGICISKEYVIKFVEKERHFFEPLHPSFFELTTAMAFNYFSEQKVDIAVIEVGLGGRLDCTNIINPILSVITNISFDHTQFLGNTLKEIAQEKSGIIKEKTPVVIGETTSETKPVFIDKAESCDSEILFAEEDDEITAINMSKSQRIEYATKHFGNITGELGGIYQKKNTRTILCAIKELIKLGLNIKPEDIKAGLSNVVELTGLLGRWQAIKTNPTVICDTGHNVGGWAYISEQLKSLKCKNLRIVFGMVDDKDVNHVMQMLPKDAIYYFTKANTKRALDEHDIKQKGDNLCLKSQCYASVKKAYEEALNASEKDDAIFIGGSSYVVADFMTDCF